MMQSQKYYMHMQLSAAVLHDAIDRQAIFDWVLSSFKKQLAEKNLGLITRPVLRLCLPDLLEATRMQLLEAHVVARVVPIQRLENVQPQ